MLQHLRPMCLQLCLRMQVCLQQLWPMCCLRRLWLRRAAVAVEVGPLWWRQSPWVVAMQHVSKQCGVGLVRFGVGYRFHSRWQIQAWTDHLQVSRQLICHPE